MFTDMFGKTRLKINLHTHTKNSDGRKSPEEAAAVYRAAGYDILAITDHWAYGESGKLGGLRILSGAEYNIGGADAARGVFHILGLGCSSRPQLERECPPQAIVDEIHRTGGLAVLAHPCWSVNTVDQLDALHGIDATEIYNRVSDAGESSRPYSGDFVDAAACRGLLFPLIADDDTHFYDGSDEANAFIMLAAPPDASDAEILSAIRKKDFYASQGPEIHLFREGNRAVVRCSPACRISFFSNAVWAKGHCLRGENLCEASCELQPFETFIRAEVTDANGKKAWSNMIKL